MSLDTLLPEDSLPARFTPARAVKPRKLALIQTALRRTFMERQEQYSRPFTPVACVTSCMYSLSTASNVLRGGRGIGSGAGYSNRLISLTPNTIRYTLHQF